LNWSKPRNGYRSWSEFVLAQSVAGAGIDDTDQSFYENYGCTSNRNYTHYCDPEIEKMIDSSRWNAIRRSAKSSSGR
jgi:hypothetical protein